MTPEPPIFPPWTRDTTVAAHQYYLANLRRMTPAERVAVAIQLSDWLRARVSKFDEESMNPAFYQAVTPVVDALEGLGIAYYIGGSIASISYGQPRSTMDVDIVAEIERRHVAPLVQQLHPLGYINAQEILDAIVRRSSFNIIPSRGAYKIDVFIPDTSQFSQSVMSRVRYVPLDPQASRPYPLPSAEDIILLKLKWYEDGNRVSTNQWNDVLGVMQTQYRQLDTAYLRAWASTLGLASTLQAAERAAGLQP